MKTAQSTLESSWEPLSLEAALDGKYEGPQPAILTRTDGVKLLYPGAIHSIAGEPGSGKSWIALVAAAEVILSGRNVLYLDFEDSVFSIVHRLKTLGVSPAEILVRFAYVRPFEPMPQTPPDAFDLWLNEVDLVVVDGVTNALETHGLDVLSNRDTAEFMNRFVSRLQEGRRSPAILLIDHVPKSRSNQRGPVGAQHKVAAVQVQYIAHTAIAFDQDHDGAIDLTLIKDRFGQIQRRLPRAGTRAGWAARIHFRHDAQTERLASTIEPPGGSRGVPSTLISEVLDVVRENPRIAKTRLKALVTGRDSFIVAAIDELVASNALIETQSSRSTVYEISHSIEPDVSPE